MVGLTRADYEDVSPFAELLPHNLLLDPEGGVLLLPHHGGTSRVSHSVVPGH